MLKLFGALSMQNKRKVGSVTERFTRFDGSETSEDLGTKYTRMPVRPKPKPVSPLVDFPRSVNAADDTQRPHPAKPHQKFDDSAHLYAEDRLSVDVLKRALPRRFKGMKSAG